MQCYRYMSTGCISHRFFIKPIKVRMSKFVILDNVTVYLLTQNSFHKYVDYFNLYDLPRS